MCTSVRNSSALKISEIKFCLTVIANQLKELGLLNAISYV